MGLPTVQCSLPLLLSLLFFFTVPCRYLFHPVTLISSWCWCWSLRFWRGLLFLSHSFLTSKSFCSMFKITVVYSISLISSQSFSSTTNLGILHLFNWDFNFNWTTLMIGLMMFQTIFVHIWEINYWDFERFIKNALNRTIFELKNNDKTCTR